MKNNEIILGISNAPALKELIYAEKGKGAYFKGKKINVSKISELKDSYLSFGGINLFERKNIINQLLNLARNCMGRRGFGDFWSYHLLARGIIDIMIEAETKIWDIAAVKLIVEESGGKVTEIKGKLVDMNTTSIIATNKLLHEEVLKFF
ncbi:Fructose-1,6-bisphosphatase/inositol-1-monophosphatase [Candidatus Tiddalikarchaeum anstoanum]|nr:Fructose-1,6-bisphosphatase/inositol-1-monophosphatase [Candidatus Tiddalikarchaeum anstoanum]